QLPETTELPDDPQALSTYLIELGQKLRFGSTFSAFAQARLHELVEERFKAAVPPPPARPARARGREGRKGGGAVRWSARRRSCTFCRAPRHGGGPPTSPVSWRRPPAPHRCKR